MMLPFSPKLRVSTVVTLCLIIGLCLIANDAVAAGAGGVMPWDTNLQKVSQSFTGPFAYALTIIGLVTACVILLFAQEIPYFIKGVVYVVLIGSLLMGANAFASSMGWTGVLV